MFFKLKYLSILLISCLLIFSGCDSSDHVTLEEAFVFRESTEEFSQKVEESEEAWYVYVCGAVVYPGVYELEKDSRIVDAIEAAGGFLEEAAEEGINLAERVKDGMQITVPTKEQLAKIQDAQAVQKAGLVNLNQATVQELCTLSGIGQAKAEAILAYRTEIGAFTSIEQLKEVAGIGESLFQQIKGSVYIE